MGNGNIEEYIKWKRKNDPGNESASAIDHHNVNNSTGNNKFNNDPNQETSTSLKKIKPKPLNKKKDEKKGILNILKIPLRKKATEEEKREATAQVKKKTPQSLKPGKLRHGKRKSRLKFRQNVKIKNQVTTNRKKRDAEAKKKPVKVKAVEAETGVNAKGKKGEKPKKKDYLTGIKEHGPLEAKHAGKVNLDEFKKEVKAEGKKGEKPYSINLDNPILTQEDKDYINALSPAAYRNLTGKYRPGEKLGLGSSRVYSNPNPKYRPGKKPKDKLIKAEENKPEERTTGKKGAKDTAQKNYQRLIKEGPWW